MKKNPLPILLITAGAAWLAYNATRKRNASDYEDDLEDENRYDPDTHYDRPLAYPGTPGAEMDEYGEEAGSKFEAIKDTVKEKASAASEQVKETLSDLGDRARETFGSVKERAGELGSRVQDRTREVYSRSRDRVAETVDRHPLEVGLGCLAVGVLVGLALPTPAPVNRFAGPTVDRLRNRARDAGRDLLKKGKSVANAATSAAKQEAESQGLTMDRLREGGRAVGERAEDAARAAMAKDADIDLTRAEPADPSAARPAM